MSRPPVKFRIGNEYFTAEELAGMAGVSKSAIHHRARKGVRGRDLLKTRTRDGRLTKLAEQTGLSRSTIRSRLDRGMSEEQVVATPREKTLGEDLVGRKFGSLRVRGRGTPNKHGQTRWVCECENCGSVVEQYSTTQLKSGLVKTCGCGRRWRLQISLFGVPLTARELAAISGLHKNTVSRLLRKGVSAEDIATKKPTHLPRKEEKRKDG